MNFEWTPEEDAFRKRLQAFLATTLPEDWERFSQHGPASPALTRYAETFCGKLAQERLLTPHWPKEIGGEGLDPWHQTILAEEMWVAGEPRGGQYMNINWIGPTLIKYGSKAQQERYLPPIAEGRALWCQGFSEPGSGSDLASLRTRAVLEGEHYRVTGQKIWTSYAGLADTCFLLCRTSEDRKRGISILLVPMDTPGITVRQIPSLIGEGDIHEVFFDDMLVPADALFGAEGQAWEIIAYSLVNERLGIPRYSLARAALDRAVSVLVQNGGWSSDAVKIEAAHCAALCEAARTSSYAIVTTRARGQQVGPESSVARFATVMAERRVAEFVVEYLPEALADAHPYLKMHHQRGIVAGIAAGAAEIQLNIIANDVLKLPREPR
ncbi:acyl-CoA dehydrogenase family protein [Blastomonas fulva]|jgi:alkylation response protein AidB-like acyl-CoA dehydrogenase|uniref:acyl-CoA dehydrogenase family protein n=1 Tax=Blastomonas fulva TaxID=1550728 RepID=UPI0025A3C443|nr:acyl-CoA dehydrogenase family protein [Blastomonas fulva]MDM7929688.1 acyl-CoA dehydrogenase family protein [Blastomonas fulva]MDM7965554.1 acyl-CoA dehydrogenase family protein [Blastomonas fulva]